MQVQAGMAQTTKLPFKKEEKIDAKKTSQAIENRKEFSTKELKTDEDESLPILQEGNYLHRLQRH